MNNLKVKHSNRLYILISLTWTFIISNVISFLSRLREVPIPGGYISDMPNPIINFLDFIEFTYASCIARYEHLSCDYKEEIFMFGYATWYIFILFFVLYFILKHAFLNTKSELVKKIFIFVSLVIILICLFVAFQEYQIDQNRALMW